ncbi:Sas10/Utp3/C1D family-domain-containing protein [Cladorrhinum sp. PSN332]|nr:Sas10/Utp3/C1D family-domain-containing protein [Cladorrhinum sp. PSN332]
MDVSDVTPQLEQLDVDIKKLEEALKPLLGDIGDLSTKLPLLDKSKLYVLMAYAIESLLFSSLRLNGADTKNHAIFSELTRVRQYFEKIQKLETPPAERETKVNTEAAARFIKNDLAGNKDIQNKLTELIAREKAKAEAAAAAAAASSAEKKRSAAEATSGARSLEESEDQKSKRPRRDASKKKK